MTFIGCDLFAKFLTQKYMGTTKISAKHNLIYHNQVNGSKMCTHDILGTL